MFDGDLHEHRLGKRPTKKWVEHAPRPFMNFRLIRNSAWIG
jgi:hypothetical protein